MILSIGAPLQTLGAPNTPLWIVHNVLGSIMWKKANYLIEGRTGKGPNRWRAETSVGRTGKGPKPLATQKNDVAAKIYQLNVTSICTIIVRSVTTIADRYMTVSWSSNSRLTGVVKPEINTNDGRSVEGATVIQLVWLNRKFKILWSDAS